MLQCGWRPSTVHDPSLGCYLYVRPHNRHLAGVCFSCSLSIDGFAEVGIQDIQPTANIGYHIPLTTHGMSSPHGKPTQTQSNSWYLWYGIRMVGWYVRHNFKCGMPSYPYIACVQLSYTHIGGAVHARSSPPPRISPLA
jgi:hypothetical protein